MTTTMAPTRDGAREKELEELGVLDPHVEWIDNDLVTLTMKRVDLDRLLGQSVNHECEVPDGYHSDDDCDHDDCDGYDDGHSDGFDEGHAKAIAELKELAGESAA